MSFEIKGWCPGALSPMETGDGLLLRVKPPLGQLSEVQCQAISEISTGFGDGDIALTNRANLQIRGIEVAALPAIQTALRAQGLVDENPAIETRRTLLISPFATPEDLSRAARLQKAIVADDRLDALPAKFGFSLDCAATRVLAMAPSDIRIERCRAGGLILRPDGSELGIRTTDDTLTADAIALAHWFLDRDAEGNARRMHRLILAGVMPEGLEYIPAATTVPKPGLSTHGWLFGLPFGQIKGEIFANLGPLRITPWRMVLTQSEPANLDALISFPDDPRLRIHACPGQPRCPQAKQPTRAEALSLAAGLKPGEVLHVSGCAKGCAFPYAADVTLVGTDQGYDLIRCGTARDKPTTSNLALETLFPDLEP